MDKHLLQEYEWEISPWGYFATVHYRTEDGPNGPDYVQNVTRGGDTDEEAAKQAISAARNLSAGEGRMTLLSLHIGRARIKMLASPLLLEEVLAKEKEAADAHD